MVFIMGRIVSRKLLTLSPVSVGVSMTWRVLIGRDNDIKFRLFVASRILESWYHGVISMCLVTCGVAKLILSLSNMISLKKNCG